MRQIKHPGPAVDNTSTALLSNVRIVHAELTEGLTLLDSVAAALGRFDSDSAVLRLTGGGFSRFCYHLPALSDHPEHAVFFSEKIVDTDAVDLEIATITFGHRDGAPWLHCHAIWLAPDGSRRCGHLVPDEILVASAIQAEICLIESVRFEVAFDTETNFSLFKPRRLDCRPLVDWPAQEKQQGLIVRAVPNQDLCETLEQLCAAHHWREAQIYGGVGSLICADFADGRQVEQLATELLIERGRVAADTDGNLRADIDIALVDYTSNVNRGRIARHINPVLVTCECVLVAK